MYVKICPFIALKNMFHTYSKAFKHMWVSTGFVLNALKWPVFCLHHQRWNLHSSLRTGWCQQLWQVKCVFQASVNIFQWTKFESMFHRLRLFSLHSAPELQFITNGIIHRLISSSESECITLSVSAFREECVLLYSLDLTVHLSWWLWRKCFSCKEVGYLQHRVK